MPSKFREYGVPALLLGASLVTITASGACFMRNFRHGLQPVMLDSDMWPWPMLMRHPHLWFSGLAFSLALLGILLIHEFGHYIACRVHLIRATLPWVLPAPTLSGTVGAIIKLRSRIPNLDALMDVGIYGPLAGYLASALAITIGFLLSHPAGAHAPEPIVRFGGEPLTIRLVHTVLLPWNPRLQPFGRIVPHPILIAGWIGLFITSLNLIPAGQLDGGHILYALSPRLHRTASRILPPALLVAGVFYWAGWILWGIILLLPAMRHPTVPNFFALSRARKVLGVIGIAIFLLTFTPTPFHDNSLLSLLHIEGRRTAQ